MREYFSHFKYTVKHKWFVFIECCKFGIPFTGLVHDWSKFRPSEFVSYAKFFFDEKGRRKKIVRDKTGCYKPTDTGNKDFDFAWFLHQKRNKHHWQYWTMAEDEEGLKILEMPHKRRLEMVADWNGAGMALAGEINTIGWYNSNKHKLQLHPNTRKKIEKMLEKDKK